MLELMGHQARAVEVLRQCPRYALFWEPGLGKTIAALAHVAERKAAGFRGRTLVLAPLSILRSAWANDARHFPSLATKVVWANNASARKRLLEDHAEVYITNHETFKKMADDFLRIGVRRLIVDESSKIKNHKSQISKAVFDFARQMDGVLLLSGTPAPNSKIEYFSQIRCIDQKAFGLNFWKFAYDYFTPVKRLIGGTDRIIGWKPLAARQPEFLRRLQNCSWALTKAECLDLPEQVDVVREVVLSPTEASAYVTMLSELQVELGEGNVLNASAQARLTKLRQITGGTVYHEGVGKPIGDAKLQVLEEVLEEIGARPVIIWAEYTAEINRIVARVAEMGRMVAVLDGSVGMEARSQAIAAFQAGGLDCLVAHPAAAGHGITLTAASYAIYYSHSFSFETYQQSRDRIHRKGQRNTCTYYHLIAAGTIDERIWAALRQKRNAHDNVMEMLKTARGSELAVA